MCVTHGHLISLLADAAWRFQVAVGNVGYVWSGIHGGENLERSCTVSSPTWISLHCFWTVSRVLHIWALESLPSTLCKVQCAAYTHSKAGPGAPADVGDHALLGLGRSQEQWAWSSVSPRGFGPNVKLGQVFASDILAAPGIQPWSHWAAFAHMGLLAWCKPVRVLQGLPHAGRERWLFFFV